MTITLNFETGNRTGLIHLPLEKQESTFGLKYIGINVKTKPSPKSLLPDLVKIIHYKVLDEKLFMLAAIKHDLEFEVLDLYKIN
ncbi:MAG: hypothetical protein RL728_64 [Bacteroidota bacterium]